MIYVSASKCPITRTTIARRPRRVLGDVIRCLESKFDKKIPMGSVPNCQKEIPDCHAIRWFKCKLKPPKKNNNTRPKLITEFLQLAEKEDDQVYLELPTIRARIKRKLNPDEIDDLLDEIKDLT